MELLETLQDRFENLAREAGPVVVMMALAVASYLLLRKVAGRSRLGAFRARCVDCDFSQEAESREVVRTAAMLHNLKTRHVVLIEGRR